VIEEIILSYNRAGREPDLTNRALAAPDPLKRQGLETRFWVRETPESRKHAAALEAAMLKPGMLFEVIDWSEDQATLPFEE
jgi:hypothetical protein